MRRFYWLFVLFLITSCNWEEKSPGYEEVVMNETPKLANEEVERMQTTLAELQKTQYVNPSVNNFVEEYSNLIEDFIEAERSGDQELKGVIAKKSTELYQKSTIVNNYFEDQDKALKTKKRSSDEEVFMPELTKQYAVDDETFYK
ncbi:MAG: hypothetical protein K1X55_06025 [Chitinophagales bacterium]|nr:hypothetical protein [Chitinophagales bacterium]